MTLADVDRLFRHWQSFPPVRILVAGFVGFEPKGGEGDKSQHLTGEEFKRLVDSLNGGRIPGIGRAHG